MLSPRCPTSFIVILRTQGLERCSPPENSLENQLGFRLPILSLTETSFLLQRSNFGSRRRVRRFVYSEPHPCVEDYDVHSRILFFLKISFLSLKFARTKGLGFQKSNSVPTNRMFRSAGRVVPSQRMPDMASLLA